MTNLIHADNLYRYYGDYCAVADVSLTLRKGEILGFLGPNGAGKTTTMHMLCGILAPSSGQININGVDLLEQPKSAKMFLGFLPDNPPLYRELTVREYLEFCSGLHRISRQLKGRVVNKAINRCNLDTVASRLIVNLSKGFQQRVGIAQAILHNPQIIILDEPTTGLDPIQIREIRNLIAELAQDHGIILSTHALSEVQQSCTHVKIIDRGRLILNETIDGLKHYMSTATLSVATRKPMDIDQISQISSIFNIEKSANNRYKIHHQLQANPAERIAETIVSSGWGLLELTPERKTIEEVFVSLTDNNGVA